MNDAQNATAQGLYSNDPERGKYSDSTCWVAACLAAHYLVTIPTRKQLRVIVEHYGEVALK